jgi:signal-transduction protein with cAMP-binding, CBS, and nucleotidyltransferase domain
MAADHVAAQLARIPIFAGLKPQQLNRIARRAEQCWFRPGAFIVRAGTPGDAAYLVLSGDAQSWPERGSRAPQEPIVPGSLVGELAMLVEHTYGLSVVAEGPVNCLKVGRDMLHGVMRADSDIAERLAGFVRQRLALTAAELRRIDRHLIQSTVPRLGAVRPPLALPDARGRPATSSEAGVGVAGGERKSAQPRGRSWAQEARHAHSARREAGT